MRQLLVFLFLLFVAACAGVAHLLGVDLYAIVDAVSKALTKGTQ